MEPKKGGQKSSLLSGCEKVSHIVAMPRYNVKWARILCAFEEFPAQLVYDLPSVSVDFVLGLRVEEVT